MARNHARILTSIWADPTFRALTPDAQRLYMLILSQPDLSACGVLAYLPRRWARLASGTTTVDVEKAALELVDAELVVVDEETDEVAVRTFVTHDGGLNNSKMRGAIRSALQAVHSLSLRALIVGQVPAEFRAQIADGIAIGSPIGSVFPDESGSPIRSNAEVGGRDSSSVSSSSSVTRCGAEAPPPTPPPQKSPRGTRIPIPYVVSAADIAWAERDHPGVDWDTETKKFVDHWRAKTGRDATKLDWPATWRNWIRRASEGFR